jgi:hypothetical protein
VGWESSKGEGKEGYINVKLGKEESYTSFPIAFDGLRAGSNIVPHDMSKESRLFSAELPIKFHVC